MTGQSDAHGNADDVVVTGLSGRFPESDNVEEFAEQLFAGVDLVTSDDRRWTPGIYGLPERCGKLKDLAHFDAAFFGVPDKLADHMDPQLRLLLEVTHEVIVDAGYCPAELRGSRTGVYVGLSRSESYNAWCDDSENINGYTMTGCASAMFPNRVSYTFDLKGPSVSIDVGCSSSMYALAQAVHDIRAGRCDSAVVAGINLCLDPFTSLNFLRMAMLSPDGRCAAFDESGQGYVRSEAVVAVLVQRRRNARRLYCTVRGVCVNNDGYKPQGIIYPSGAMQLRIAQETFEVAGLRPQDVVYVEAHGTGTKAGDPEEVNAIAELFCKDRQGPLLMGAVKSNMGHPEAPAGLCTIAKIIMAMECGVIPGNLHYKNPNTRIPALSDGRLKVVVKNTTWQGGLVAVNSFGFGGANGHAILEGGRGVRPPPADYLVPRLVLASGRTDEAVEQLLKLAGEHPCDAELHALMDSVHAYAIAGHTRRGYTVLDSARGRSPVLEVLEIGGEPRPVWFVFSGMGSQWPGMARDLMRLPTFAASIAQSAKTLEPYGVDLRHVIAEAPAAAFDNMINCFVSITAVQVAMVDVLFKLGVHPDGFIGHSLGEMACAYADGSLTAEQTVLCAYWRGRCTLDAAPAPGAMAAVGLSWEEAARRCPADIELACHNSLDSVTISGPLASMEKFVEQLSSDGVFVRLVNTSGVAFHSKYIANVAPLLRARLEQLIPDPKPRSARWLSSSVPEDQWSSDLARLSDAAYHVNNLLRPVRFAGVLTRVPPRALLIEVAPHALLQAVLKRALPDAAHVPLMRRDAQEPLAHLLAAIGKAYVAGAQPQVSCLYPAVSWPVSRGTPRLASHVGWDHSVERAVPDYKTAVRTGQNIVEYDFTKPEDAFITGHNIDGRILFPGTGYLVMVWRTVAKMNNRSIEQVPVIFENVNFHRATLVPRDEPLRFHVSLLGKTGEFEICEAGEVIVTGRARLTDNPAAERLQVSMLEEAEEPEKEDLPPLNSEDFYKELRLRGYNYKGRFLGVKSSDARGTRGLLQWDGNWIAFMDTTLQMTIIGANTRDLYLPARIQRVVIDPLAHRDAVEAAAGGCVPVRRYINFDTIISGGVEFRGVTTSLTPRRVNIQDAPKLEKHIFFPFYQTCFEDNVQSKMHAFTAAIHLVVENCGALHIKLSEPALQRATDVLLLPNAIQVLQGEPQVRTSATLAAGADAPSYVDAMEPLGVKVSNQCVTDGGLETECHLVLGVDVLAQHSGLLATLSAASAGFVLLEEPVGTLEQQLPIVTAAGLSLILRTRCGTREYVLLQHATTIPVARAVVEVREDDYGWVEHLKDAMKRAESEDMRVYVWSRAPDSGVQGLATCLRREPGGNRLRLYYLPGADAFDPDSPAYRDQVRHDLAFNVLRDGVWGTYRHLPLDDIASTLEQVEHAYVHVLNRGDLSSLRWVESDQRHETAALPQQENTTCRVYYAALNFRDIMIATGKLALLAFKGHVQKGNHILGLEYSGRLPNNKRVMGIVIRGLATTVQTESGFMWEVPKDWTLEEAATVPIAYATAYCALCVRGRMRRGESVLVHAGAGGVGQAAIAVALHAGCTVFTTVGSAEKRAFLRARFPQLPDANIGNSRDCSFEKLVLGRTRGRGVDLVLNSLTGDHLQASIRCLATGGRFLEIGKADLNANTPLGMAILLNNTAVYGVFLDMLFDMPSDNPDKAEIYRCVAEGIAAGVVRPLPATVYANNQIEQAFRYMATGKHIGKVLIRVREDETSDAPAPMRLLSAVPRTYMHPGKSYVLIGGLGGFGLELAEWLTSRGARTLVLSSRSGVQTGFQAQCIHRWRLSGVNVLVSTVDAATPAGARALLQAAAAEAPVGGIFNLAVVLHDAILENQTPDAFCSVAKPKINVTRSLDLASRELAPDLDHFVAFSSVSSGRGNPGQSNYGFANSGMERLCEQRREAGLPALAVQWGAVGDVGLVAALFGEDAELGGTVPQRIASCLQTLETLLAQPHTVVSSMVIADKRRAQNNHELNLIHSVANVLGIRDVEKASQTATLSELGMDSLMGAEIKERLEHSFDLICSVQEVRALTFDKLRELAGARAHTAPVAAGAGVTSADKLKKLPSFSLLVPEQVLVELPSQPPVNPRNKPLFMVHPIEGVVDMLRGVASRVHGKVYGLQCTRAAPLDNMAALARFYVTQVRAEQPYPPYTLLGYSFGTAVVFEMALQLEQDDCPTRVVLIDGSPAFIKTLTTHSLKKRDEDTVQYDDADVLAFLAHTCYGFDPTEVTNELKQLPDGEARLARLTEMITAAALGARVHKESVRDAAHDMYRKLMIGHQYEPAARLLAPVSLFVASDNFIAQDEDYGLRAVCAGELRTRRLAGSHRSILEGDGARAIADHVSDLLEHSS